MEKLKIDRDRPSMYLMVKSMNTHDNNAEGLSFDQFLTLVMSY